MEEELFLLQMSKPYKNKYSSKKWKDRRDEVLERDGHQCCRCERTDNLHVHHRYYISGREAWQYPEHALVTLCPSCHGEEHGPQTEDLEWIFEPTKFTSDVCISRIADLVHSMDQLSDRLGNYEAFKRVLNFIAREKRDHEIKLRSWDS